MSEDEQNEDSSKDPEQSDQQPMDSEQSQESESGEESAKQSDSQQADETQQSDEQSGATSTGESEQPTEESTQSDSQTGEQSEQSTQESDQPADDTSQQAPSEGSSSDTVAGEPATTGALNAKRQSMLDLIDKWMPTSLNNPRVPDGETQDLMTKAGWTKSRGQQSKQEKDAGGHPVTSCGDILAAMLRLWRSNFIGAFMIRDQDSKGRTPGAKGLGYYVEADGVQSPQPGDIVVLRNGVGQGSAGTVGHVGILVESGESEWRTADGGGGALPDQTASVSTRTVRFENGVAILKSPTDLKEKQLDGWVDLNKLEQTG